TLAGACVRYQKAKQEQPSTPQKACSSETGIDDLFGSEQRLLTPGLRLETTAPTLAGACVRYQKAKQEQPSTPQKACSSETGIDDL
ncbi:hypothetical protein CK247_30030, partial [Klebsiella pneumoniae]